MYPISLQQYHADPALRRRLLEAAHRERTQAVRAGFAWLRARILDGLFPAPDSLNLKGHRHAR